MLSTQRTFGKTTESMYAPKDMGVPWNTQRSKAAHHHVQRLSPFRVSQAKQHGICRPFLSASNELVSLKMPRQQVNSHGWPQLSNMFFLWAEALNEERHHQDVISHFALAHASSPIISRAVQRARFGRACVPFIRTYDIINSWSE